MISLSNYVDMFPYTTLFRSHYQSSNVLELLEHTYCTYVYTLCVFTELETYRRQWNHHRSNELLRYCPRSDTYLPKIHSTNIPKLISN